MINLFEKELYKTILKKQNNVSNIFFGPTVRRSDDHPSPPPHSGQPGGIMVKSTNLKNMKHIHIFEAKIISSSVQAELGQYLAPFPIYGFSKLAN